MLDETVLQILSEKACPSIRYRIRSEIFGENLNDRSMQQLQTMILQDQKVLSLIAAQSADGWIGKGFHGYDTLEAGIRLLAEKGVQLEAVPLAKALDAVSAQGARAKRELGRVGQVLDAGGFGGVETMRAYLLAHGGYDEENVLVKGEIGKALAGFEFVLGINALDEISETYRDKLIYKEEVRWPGLYQLRLLAYTHDWRTEQNLEMMRQAIGRLVQLSPFPDIYVRYRSQLMAPTSFGMDKFVSSLDELTDAEWMVWFHRMELLARLGVVSSNSALQQQVDALDKMLEAGDGWLIKKLSHPYFHKWGGIYWAGFRTKLA